MGTDLFVVLARDAPRKQHGAKTPQILYNCI